MQKGPIPIFIILVFVIIYFASPLNIGAQTEITNIEHSFEFGKEIRYKAYLQTYQPVEKVKIIIWSDGDHHTEEGTVDLQAKSGGYELSYAQDLSTKPLRAFCQVSYQYEVYYANGEIQQSETNTFKYEDNRFAWRTLESAPFTLHWYAGDATLARSMLEVGHQGLQRVASLLQLSEPEPVDIYIYTNSVELQQTLSATGESWVAGHADPDLGVMVVALPEGPDRLLLAEQRLPHELMHIMLYRSVGAGYANLPIWLSEGMASQAELYPNPDYQVMLDAAYKKQALYPMVSLCRTFPRPAQEALLAYSQSASFVRFIYHTYGSRGLNTLINHYADGLDCEKGVQASLGVSLNDLERRWRQETFRENAAQLALSKIMPWLLLMFTILLAPVGLALPHWFKKARQPA